MRPVLLGMALRRPRSAPRPGRSGHGAGPRGPRCGGGGTRRESAAREPRSAAPPTPRTWEGRGAGRALSPGVRLRRAEEAGCEHGRREAPGAQSAGRAVPGRGRWHLRPMRTRRGGTWANPRGTPRPRPGSARQPRAAPSARPRASRRRGGLRSRPRERPLLCSAPTPVGNARPRLPRAAALTPAICPESRVIRGRARAPKPPV